MAISVRIRKHLGGFQLNIEFVSESRRIGILGASGCGKSMTLKSIAGIETPDEGRIEVEGRVLFDRDRKINLKPQKRNVGYLFQNYALFPTMSVEKNIAAGLRCGKKQREEKVREMIGKFRLSGLEKRLPGQLSGGQQQRVALARIMAYEPDVILLDEPFSALDMYLKDQLQQELIRMLEDYRGTVIMVSHNRDEVYRFSEELLIIDQGKVEAAGKTEEIFRYPVTQTAAKLTGCKNFSRIRKLDAHMIHAADWGILLHLEQEISDDIRWIGYRAHDFVPVWGKRGENMLRFDPGSSALLPFERNYYIRPEKYGGWSETVAAQTQLPAGSGPEAEQNPHICWFVQRDLISELEKRGMPDYLFLKEDRMLFLR